MKRTATFALAAIALLGLTSVAAASLRSTTWIEAGQTFLLGGGQPGRFRVEATNSGGVPLTMLVQPEGGTAEVLAELDPGERATHVFRPGEMAQFRNDAERRRGEVRLVVSDPDGLGMRYQPNNQ
jgi:hypothetical protein